MNKITALILVALLGLAFPVSAERINAQYTITAGTPIRISAQTLKMNRLIIQSRHGNTGLVYIMLGVPTGKTCNASDTTQLTAELGPGDATHPGNSLSDPQGANGDSPADVEDMAMACLDGTHTGDLVLVSGWHRN